MRELSLFTGAGGGLLGTHLLGWEPCGYVEWNQYCQKVIAQRIRDGFLPIAPIFTDVREFIKSGAAEQYRGIADVVSAGFPCQPFSNAGKQLGEDDERNMWPETADTIRIVQPASVLLENVRGLISSGYIGTVLCDLASLGYVGRWGIFSARAEGAPHLRERLFIVAHSASKQCNEGGYNSRNSVGKKSFSKPGNHSWAAYLANPDRSQRKGMRGPFGVSQEHTNACAASVGWWRTDPADVPESGVERMVDGLADGMDKRLEAIGNGQVPAVVRTAWELLA